MPGFGTVLNVCGIVAGGVLGSLFGDRLGKNYRETLMLANAISVLFVGIAGAMSYMLKVSGGELSAQGTLMLVVSMAAGGLLGELADLIERGVSVRLIHAKEPGPNFRKDFDRYPILATGLERVLCPRVHFKLLIFDLKTAYIGSANLTGAGIGMKSDGKRNFEAGIWTDDPRLVAAAVAQFDSVWMGAHCDACRRKAFCNDSIL